MNLDARLEVMLFAAAKPLSIKRLAEWCEVGAKEVEEALASLANRLFSTGSGLQLMRHGQEAELVTRPEWVEDVRKVVKDEVSGELSRPSLEALAVLAYRGPMTRPELEQIRGVQSSLILRNLMLRGLVDMRENGPLGQPVYSVTIDFLKHIGTERVDDLPDFEKLRANTIVRDVLKELEPSNMGDKIVDGPSISV